MKFTVYSKDGCPYCDKIKDVLKLANLEHVVYELDLNFTREQFYDQFGMGSTFPQVVVDDELPIGGSSDTIRYLRENQLV